MGPTVDKPATDDPAATRLTARRTTAVDMAILVLVTVAVRIPAYFADRGLTFDDGNFALSALAMRNGEVPFRDVFSSQGPLFLPIVRAGDLLGMQTSFAPRTAAVISGVVTVLAAYSAVRRLSDRLGARVAGGLLAVSGALAWVTAPLAADGPALAFAALAVAAAVRLRDEPSWWCSLGVGLAVGATLSTKSLEAPVLVPVAMVLLAPLLGAARRRDVDAGALGRAAAAAGAAAVVYMSVTLWFGFSAVWDQSFRYRADASADRDMWGTFAKICSTMWDRDIVMLLFAVVAVAAALLARRGGAGDKAADASPTPSGGALTWAWFGATMVWLVVVVSPLWRPHVAAVAVPLAFLVGVHRPPLRATLITAVVALPLVVVQLDGLLVPSPLSERDQRLTELLAELPDGSLIISDEPGVVWWSGHSAPGDLVDSSILRREQARYTEQSLAEDARDARVCAVVRTSTDRFAAFAGLPARLERLGFVPIDEPALAADFGTTLYVRADCVD